jgi:hypothetical protein
MVGADEWPEDKLGALRLGRRLVVEVPASRPGRRAFVSLQHAEEYLDTYDYDVGAERILRMEASDETELSEIIGSLGLVPMSFQYPWDTADPQ